MVRKTETRSITKRVTWSLLMICTMVFLVSASIILERSHHTLLDSLDQELQTRAEALAAFADLKVDGGVRFDFADESMPEYSTAEPRAYFLLLQDGGGQEIERSRSLENVALELPASVKSTSFDGAEFWNGAIQHKNVRLIALRATIRLDVDDDNEDSNSRPPELKSEERVAPQDDRPIARESHCLVIVAVDTQEIDRQFFDIFRQTTIVSVVGLVVLLLTGRLILLWNLKPLNDFKEEVKAISSTNLAPVSVPSILEISVVATTLNDMIGKLRESFERERQFTSAVAHELRTPISELRTLAEVALRWPEHLNQESLGNFRDVFNAAIRMQYIVDNLLTLSRFEAGTLKCHYEPIELNDLARTVLDYFAPKAASKKITLNCHIGADFRIISDRRMVELILNNLLANAVDYSIPEGIVDLRAEEAADRFIITVANTTKNLSSDDLPFIFDRFWRKDAARTSGDSHLGLGLSIVKSIAHSLGFEIIPELTKAGGFTISIVGKLDKTIL